MRGHTTSFRADSTVILKVVMVLVRADSSVVLEFDTTSDTGITNNKGLEQESFSLKSLRAHTLGSGSMVIAMSEDDDDFLFS